MWPVCSHSILVDGAHCTWLYRTAQPPRFPESRVVAYGSSLLRGYPDEAKALLNQIASDQDEPAF